MAPNEPIQQSLNVITRAATCIGATPLGILMAAESYQQQRMIPRRTTALTGGIVNVLIGRYVELLLSGRDARRGIELGGQLPVMPDSLPAVACRFRPPGR